MFRKLVDHSMRRWCVLLRCDVFARSHVDERESAKTLKDRSGGHRRLRRPDANAYEALMRQVLQSVQRALSSERACILRTSLSKR